MQLIYKDFSVALEKKTFRNLIQKHSLSICSSKNLKHWPKLAKLGIVISPWHLSTFAFPCLKDLYARETPLKSPSNCINSRCFHWKMPKQKIILKYFVMSQKYCFWRSLKPRKHKTYEYLPLHLKYKIFMKASEIPFSYLYSLKGWYEFVRQTPRHQ